MTEREALTRILEIAYAGHPDGREARLAMIERYAKAALGEKALASELKTSENLRGG